MHSRLWSTSVARPKINVISSSASMMNSCSIYRPRSDSSVTPTHRLKTRSRSSGRSPMSANVRLSV